MTFLDLLKLCGNVRYEPIKGIYGYNRNYFYLIDPNEKIKVPDNIFIEITKTAIKGTIGKLIGIDPYLRVNGNISSYDSYYILKIDGRKKPTRIIINHAEILKNYTGPTCWQYKVNSKPKTIVKSPINKFKQELKRGDWVIGVAKGSLRVARITRWTNFNVWGVPNYNLDDKSKEFRFDSIHDTFLMPDDQIIQNLTIAALKGWCSDR